MVQLCLCFPDHKDIVLFHVISRFRFLIPACQVQHLLTHGRQFCESRIQPCNDLLITHKVLFDDRKLLLDGPGRVLCVFHCLVYDLRVCIGYGSVNGFLHSFKICIHNIGAAVNRKGTIVKCLDLSPQLHQIHNTNHTSRDQHGYDDRIRDK